jgi:hypothetical protein
MTPYHIFTLVRRQRAQDSYIPALTRKETPLNLSPALAPNGRLKSSQEDRPQPTNPARSLQDWPGDIIH